MAAEEVHLEVESTARDETRSKGLGDLVQRFPSRATPSATFTASVKVVLEPRETLVGDMAEDSVASMSQPKQWLSRIRPLSSTY
jgi:hypothetical protein